MPSLTRLLKLMMLAWTLVSMASAGAGPVHQAAGSGNVALVRRLLDADSGAVNSRGDNGESPLHTAATVGDADMARVLIAAGAEVDMRDRKLGSTPLMIAAMLGHDAVVAALLNERADPDVSSFNGTTALHLAAHEGHQAIVRRLLESGANREARNRNGLSAEDFAARMNHQGVAQILQSVAPAPPSDHRALRALREQFEDLDARLRNMALDNTRLESWLQDEMARMEAVSAGAMESGADGLRRVGAELEATRRQVAAVEQVLDDLRARLENEQDSRQAEIADMRAALAEPDDNLTRLGETLTSQAERIDALDRQLAANERLLAGLAEKWEMTARDLTDAVLAARADHAGELAGQLSRVEERLRAMDVERLEFEGALTEKLRAVADDEAEIVTRLDELVRRIDELEDDVRRTSAAPMPAPAADKAALLEIESRMAADAARFKELESRMAAAGGERARDLDRRLEQLNVRLRELETRSAAEPAAVPMPPAFPAEIMQALQDRLHKVENILAKRLDQEAAYLVASPSDRSGFEAQRVVLSDNLRPVPAPSKPPAAPQPDGGMLESVTSDMAAPPAPSADQWWFCAMHVHTAYSSGRYDLPELTRVAHEQGVDAIFLSDSWLESIQYGLPPLRHVFWMRMQNPSVIRMGLSRYLAAVDDENARQQDVLYVPGVELVPRIYWTGSLRERRLTCHNHQRNLIVMGVEDNGVLERLPLANGYIPGRDRWWVALTRMALALFVLACLAMLFLSRFLAQRSGLPWNMIVRSFLTVCVAPAFVLMLLLNLAAARVARFAVYGPERNCETEQKVLDALDAAGWVSFWAHPEAPDLHEFALAGLELKISTQPYPEVLAKTSGYTGFAGVNEGANRMIEPGGVWDQVLMEYLAGRRAAPAWCFGEMLYHYEGQAGKRLSNVQTVIRAPERDPDALLAAVRRGDFYARRNHETRALRLRSWQVQGAGGGAHVKADEDGAVNLYLGVDGAIADETAEVTIIRDGRVVHREMMTVPFDLAVRDTLPDGMRRAYYRAMVTARYPVRLVVNPVFVDRR